MPNFRYRAVTPEGAVVTGVKEAATPAMVRNLLSETSLTAVDVRPKKSIWAFEITQKKVPRKELMHFSRQLSAFLISGIPVLEGLEAIEEEQQNKLFRQIIREIADDLRSGAPFATAAAAHPEAFPPFYIGVLESAELTGNLASVLDQLSGYIERDMDARRRIVAALVYPAIIMVMSIVVVIVLSAYVLPRFETFFSQLNAKLPLPTRILLSISHFLRHWWFVFAAAAGGLVVALLIAIRNEKFKEKRDYVLLHIPVAGDVIRHAVLERFCRILSSMVQAGVPLIDSLTVTSQATGNAVYRNAMERTRLAMVRGEGLARPLAETGLFPAAARQMFRVGEETGTLDHKLETAAEYFDRELEFKIKSFTAIFEPAVIVFMGLIVGFVAVALISAMYGIFRQVKV
jgi:type IV pilus assembly protein PilC